MKYREIQVFNGARRIDGWAAIGAKEASRVLRATLRKPSGWAHEWKRVRFREWHGPSRRVTIFTE